MEPLPGGNTRFRRRRHYPSGDRFLAMLQQPPSSSPSPPLELSEHDIFDTPLECLPPSSTRPTLNPDPKPAPTTNPKQYGILAAVTISHTARSAAGLNTRPVFNHKASPVTSATPVLTIRKPPPAEGARARFRPRSAPVNIPVVPAALMKRRAMEIKDAISEGEEEEDEDEMVFPPHEVVADRHPPRAACSVMEGAGRTLKGRDLRQVRNAVWRKIGFLD
ncbi:hypothetical protein STAS_00945 [Striga asiatica]|uniref:Uncharacterized protein n=1 Tax=Striga asiatica TaxID=4170 RepID=A0A5A7NXX2_STRAF|nr:hypothetical protein STAS_00945 [Striga asiatica]